MRIHLKVSLIISLLFINSIAQNAPDTLWTKIFDGGEYWGGDFGYCVQQTLDGGYIVCGSRADSTTIYPGIWILKTDQTGDTLWSRTFPGHHGRGRDCLQQTVDGGFALVGTHLGRIFLIKTDTNGDTLWTKFYDIEEISGTGSVYQTHDGGYIITGSTPETDNYFSDVVLIRTNSSGDTIWTKTYDRHYGDLGYSVQQTLDGGYIIAAETGWWGDFWSDIWLRQN